MPRLVMLEEVRPRIFHLNFETQYEVCMHLLRWSEFYESPEWSGKNFRLLDYIEWYTKGQGKGAFTYTKDWTGFNIPSWSILQLLELGIPDPNKYDEFMLEMIKYVRRSAGDRFYLIGTFGEGKALEHEIAHGYYFLSLNYRKSMDGLFGEVEKADREKIWKIMEEMGYANHVFPDELQAYSATGYTKKMKEIVAETLRKPFINVFKQYDKKQEAKLAGRAK